MRWMPSQIDLSKTLSNTSNPSPVAQPPPSSSSLPLAHRRRLSISPSLGATQATDRDRRRSDLGHVTPPHPPVSLHHHLSPFSPPSFILFVSSFPSMGCSPPFMGSFSPIVASSSPYVEFTGSHGDLCLFEDRGFLMWLVSSLWQMVWGFHPTRALPLERFRSESFMISPPCLRSDPFKHLIVVCLCANHPLGWKLFLWFACFPFTDLDYTSC